MTTPPLTLRLEKGTPLTSAEMDENLRILRDFQNALAALFSVALNPDGTLKAGAVTATTSIADRIITSAKMDWLFNFYTVAAGTNTYTAAITPVGTFSYGDGITGSFIAFIKFTNANTGTPCTLNVNGGGAKTIKKNVNQDLNVGDISAGCIHCVAYDGTNFQLLSSIPRATMVTGAASAEGVGNGAALGAAATNIGTITLTLPLSANTWTWIKFVFSGQIEDTPKGSIASPIIKVGGAALTLVNNWGGALEANNSDDVSAFTFIAEGPPTGFLSTTPLNLDLYAQYGSTLAGDTIARRKMYAVGWYN